MRRLLPFPHPCHRHPLAAPADVLRALARVRASQGHHSWAVSLFNRAIDSSTSSSSSDGKATSDGVCRSGDDVPSLCGLAQLLLTPRVRRRPLPLPLSTLPSDECATRYRDHRGTYGGAIISSGPEMEADPSPTASKTANTAKPAIGKSRPKRAAKTASSAVMQENATPGEAPSLLLLRPSDEDKDEAARLLARAFTAAGGTLPLENAYFGGGGGGGRSGDGFVGSGGIEDGGEMGAGGGGNEVVPSALAEVHLVASGFSLQGRGGRSSGDSVDGEREWHLHEAARAAPHTKTGLTAR